ncbi:hypothetical protein [Brevibacterium casei]
MRHDAERERTHSLLDSAPVPELWNEVLAHMRTSPLTSVTRDDILAGATGLLLVTPGPEVVAACFGDLLGAFDECAGFVRVVSPEALVADGSPTPVGPADSESALAVADVPAGTWIFLPHRHDGWEELETASARLHRLLVKENTRRDRHSTLTLLEYGINLWQWAEPPSSGGDPVCHAGELISWESAWALEAHGDDTRASETHRDGHFPSRPPLPGRSLGGKWPSRYDVGRSQTADTSASLRPPIYFGLPPVLMRRRFRG